MALIYAEDFHFVRDGFHHGLGALISPMQYAYRILTNMLLIDTVSVWFPHENCSMGNMSLFFFSNVNLKSTGREISSV